MFYRIIDCIVAVLAWVVPAIRHICSLVKGINEPGSKKCRKPKPDPPGRES